jgi:hypothetical protein
MGWNRNGLWSATVTEGRPAGCEAGAHSDIYNVWGAGAGWGLRKKFGSKAVWIEGEGGKAPPGSIPSRTHTGDFP